MHSARRTFRPTTKTSNLLASSEGLIKFKKHQHIEKFLPTEQSSRVDYTNQQNDQACLTPTSLNRPEDSPTASTTANKTYVGSYPFRSEKPHFGVIKLIDNLNQQEK